MPGRAGNVCPSPDPAHIIWRLVTGTRSIVTLCCSTRTPGCRLSEQGVPLHSANQYPPISLEYRSVVVMMKSQLRKMAHHFWSLASCEPANNVDQTLWRFYQQYQNITGYIVLAFQELTQSIPYGRKQPIFFCWSLPSEVIASMMYPIPNLVLGWILVILALLSWADSSSLWQQQCCLAGNKVKNSITTCCESSSLCR